MPCNSVATAQAQVTEDHLRQYLQPDLIAAPLLAYLQARFPQATVTGSRWAETLTWTIFAGGAGTTLTVRNGVVSVRADQWDPAAAAALAAEFRQALIVIAAASWQQATAQYLAQHYAVTQSQGTADGSLVLRLQL